MAIFPFLGVPRRPRTERGERHLLAMRILTDAVSGPGTSVHAWSDDDRLCFKLAVDGGPSIEFRGFDSRGRAAFHVDLSEGGLAFVELDPRTWVDPGLFNRRAPILDRKGRPTITEAKFVSEVAARYVDLYRDVVARAEGMRGVLSASGKGVAALKATAFVASCEARGMDAVTWAQAAEAARMWSHHVEAREIRRLVGEEMVAALTGTPRMTDDRSTGKPGGPLQN